MLFCFPFANILLSMLSRAKNDCFQNSDEWELNKKQIICSGTRGEGRAKDGTGRYPNPVNK